MATKKTTTKKIVKKPMMKKGGIKKPLRKAQNGQPVGPYMQRSTTNLPPSKDTNIYQGPLNERDVKALNENYPSTVGGKPYHKGGKDKKLGYISPETSEAYSRRNDENYLRSSAPDVQRFNKIEGYIGDYPTTSNPTFKKGGVTKKYEVGGMTDTQTCGGPGKPKCRKKFKSKGKSQETKGSILGTLGAIAGGIGGYAAYKKLKEKKKGGATKMKTGGMVNANANLVATKSAGSKGVKSGVNPKAAASKVARGRSGGTSVAPKKATPGRK
jgi:hypothetical protein